MKDEYDFSKGKRGRVLPADPEPTGLAQVTIRLSRAVLDRFFEMAEQSGGSASYDVLINSALEEYLGGQTPKFEDTLRRIIREELRSSAA
jgi:hypothetical protein